MRRLSRNAQAADLNLLRGAQHATARLRPSVVPGPVVVAEVDRGGLELPDLFQRPVKGRDVLHHPFAGALTLEHLDRPAGIAGHQGRPFGRIDLNALVAGRVPWRGDGPDAGHDLLLTVEEFPAGSRIVQPLDDGVVRL